MSAALTVRGLVVEAPGEKGVRLLGPVHLTLERGEHVLLVGPSGCGKSTLLRAIAGLVEPSAGTIELEGEPASSPGRVLLPPERRGIGFLFQGGALWPHMSAAKQLDFVLARRGRRHTAAELLELVDLAGCGDRMPATLSGGEAQRLALARALAADPRLVLLDEPLGPLDAELRGALIERLHALHESLGWTALHVTHDPREAEHIASRTLRMRDGRFEEDRA